MGSRKCSLCRFCKFNDRKRSFACHNEASATYGEVFDCVEASRNKSCENFAEHRYNALSLKEALLFCSLPKDFVGLFTNYKTPDNGGPATVTLAFNTNEALMEWMDAKTRLFMEYMTMAKADGDFNEEGENG